MPSSGANPTGGTPSATNPSSSAPGSSVSVSVAAIGPASSATPPPSKPPTPTDVDIISVPLSAGNNAADIAAALKGNIPGVVSVTALNDTKLAFVVDSSVKTLTPAKLTGWVSSLAQFRSPQAVKVVAKHLNEGSGSAADVAPKLNGIPGVTNIIPLGNTTLLFLLDLTPDARFPSTPRNTTALEGAIDRILSELDRLAAPPPIFYMLPFPLGTGKNCDIATTLAKQLPGVLNISPVGSTRLAFEIDPRLDADHQKALKDSIDQYVTALAEPVTPPSPNTETYTQRLFYDHDPTTAAAIIQAAFPEVKAAAIVPDTVVLSETIPTPQGKKRDPLQDARRLIAEIDKPRPQIALETWSIQVSTSDEKYMQKVGPEIERIAKKYNDVIESSAARGWEYLFTDMHTADVDHSFSDYLTHQTYADFAPGQIYLTCCSEIDADYGYAGGTDGYALGYTTLFKPLPRNLAYWLIALAANNNPRDRTDRLVNVMETGNSLYATLQWFPPSNVPPLGHTPRRADGPCDERDAHGYKGLIQHHHDTTLQLECARDALSNGLFAPDTSGIGPFRAAVADFLFQYKMSVQYQDEFQPFSFSQAAANLDAQLSPIVDAFISDLEVFQNEIRKEIEEQPEQGQPEQDQSIFHSKHVSYAASGIVSVKVVAGNQAQVQTTTQNYFDATPPVRLGDIAAAIKSIGTGTTSSSGASVAPNLPGVLTSNMSANEAVLALSAIQALTRTPVSAKIGKGLTLTATAYSLSGASGAEMDVAVESNENGAELLTAATSSNLSSTQAQTDDMASRVSDHKVSTRVRVDSLNLFSLSTMESVLARGKTPWRPIDPWLELPVFGELVRVPRKPALTYHRSFIFIDALVVPTSADLANEALGGEDVVQEQPGGARYKRAHQAEDLGDTDTWGLIREYHMRRLREFAAETLGPDGSVINKPAAPLGLQGLPSVK
jgi:hypothetical protein